MMTGGMGDGLLVHLRRKWPMDLSGMARFWPQIRGFLSNSLGTFLSVETYGPKGFDVRQENARIIQVLHHDTAFQAETGRMDALSIIAHPFGQC